MKIKFLAAMISLVSFSQLSNAQTQKTDLIKDWERAKTYTKEYLEAMPDKNYSLKPTPEMRSFAQQLLHLADANYTFVSNLSGAEIANGKDKLEKATDQSKANVSKHVLSSYDYVIENISKLSDEQLAEKIKLFGQMEMSRSTALGKLFEHQTHHRGQTTVYIRLANVTPPNEKLF